MNPTGTSFIPQRPTQGKIKNRGVRKIYVLTYVSYVMFFGALMVAGATLFYTYVLEAQLQRQKDLLVAERAKFSQSEMASIQELDRRIDTAKQRMDAHISVPSIFQGLENSAVESLDFIGFTYKRLNDDAPLVSIKGSASMFNSVLFQREVLSRNPILAGAVFTEAELSLDKKSDEEFSKSSESTTKTNITFIIDAEVDPELVPYTPRVIESLDTDSTSADEEGLLLLDSSQEVE